MRRAPRRCAAVLLLASAIVLALASDAGAHALLRSSTPAANAVLSDPPEGVTVVFTEEPEPSLSSIHVLGSSAAGFEQGRPRRVASDDRALRVDLRPLPRGVYTVAWRVVSRVDGHATAGSFAFGVQVAVTPESAKGPTAVAPRSPPPSGLEMAGRFGLFLGLLGLIGAAWVAAVAYAEPPTRIVRVAGWAWGLGASGLVLLGVAQARAASGASFTDLLSTPLGRALIWRAAALLAGGAALVAVRGTKPVWGRRLLWIAAISGAGLAYAHVAAGHAGASSPRAAEIAAQAVHVVAAAAWIGGLIALLVGLPGVDPEARSRAVRRFSTAAAFLLAIVLATGVVRALAQLHAWNDLWDSGYGRVIAAKVALIVVLAALGAANRYRNVPRVGADPGGLRRVSRVEASFGVATLAAAALLASLAPPPKPAAAAPPAGIVLDGADFGTTVRVRLSAVPGTAGPNRFEVRLEDYDTRAAITDAAVSLRFTFLDDPRVGQAGVKLVRAGDVYRAEGLALSLAGRWSVAVLIERGTSSLEVRLRLGTRCIQTSIPGSPVIYVVALSGGDVAQGYLDPERAGKTEVHVTFFDVAGRELSVPGDTAIRASSGDVLQELQARRLGPGHFVADTTLAAGDWRFDFAATARAGQQLRGCFTETVRQ
jgi:copper transport protein